MEETGRLPNGNQVAKVEVDGSNWYFNVEVLVLIAKSGNIYFSFALQRRLSMSYTIIFIFLLYVFRGNV